MKDSVYYPPKAKSVPLAPYSLCAGSPFRGSTGGALDYTDGNLAESPIFDPNPLNLE